MVTATPTLSSFVENGYCLMRDFLAPDDLAPLAGAIEQILTVPPHPGMSRPGNDLFPLRWSDDIIARLLKDRQRLGRLSAVIGASDLKWLSGYVSTKPAHSLPLWWHQDWWCWDHPLSFRRQATQIAVLCYPSAIDTGNGALRVLPGSHRASAPIHRLLPEPHSESANALDGSHPAMNNLKGQVTPDLREGDAIVIDYRLLHGTHANNTGVRRDCIILSFLPDWDTLPEEFKAHLIMHPALPDKSRGEYASASGYKGLLPEFDHPAVSLPLNRVPPPSFTANR